MEFNKLYGEKGFDFFLSIDCEGPNFDKDLDTNVKCLQKLLEFTALNNIYVILFITPYFADALKRLDLVDKIKDINKVIFGLHIHPDNLPEDIKSQCPFLIDNVAYMAYYTYEEQKSIINEALKYIENRGITQIQGFRGGYFSINDDTLRALKEITSITWESHNVFRKEYEVKYKILKSCPVYAYSDVKEFRLEYFDEESFNEMIINAILNEEKILAITHSYLLNEYDDHYKRDNITKSIYSVLQIVIDKIKVYQDNNNI